LIKRLGRTGVAKRVSIKDVAALAGVSVTTVSHVLNDTPGKRVKPETRERVQKVAADLGYQASSIARSLRSQRSQIIALVSDVIATTPHAGRIILGAQAAASRHGWLLMLVNSGGDPAVERAEIQALAQRQVDGFIYATMYHREVELPDALRSVPTVLLDARTSDPSVPSAVPDEYTAGRAATQTLIDAGHRRIGYTNNIDDIPATRGRLAGYHDALVGAGIEPDPDLVITAESDTQGGLEAGRALLDRPRRPTAVFAFNDRMAMGVYHAAAERGVRVPDQLSVIGFDNQELIAEGLRPQLTTMALPHYEMGVWAVDALIQRIKEPETEAEQVELACPLVVRDSVAPPRDAS
jgi:LacI family transcriptional regulator